MNEKEVYFFANCLKKHFCEINLIGLVKKSHTSAIEMIQNCGYRLDSDTHRELDKAMKRVIEYLFSLRFIVFLDRGG